MYKQEGIGGFTVLISYSTALSVLCTIASCYSVVYKVVKNKTAEVIMYDFGNILPKI